MRTTILILSACAVSACGRVALEGADAGSSSTGGGVAAAGGGSTAGGSPNGGGTAGGSGFSGGSAGGNAAGGATGGGTVGDPCSTLGVTACRANPRCTPDFCFQCSCRPNFVQCRLKTSPEYQCPMFGCAQPTCCKADTLCGRPLVCIDADAPTCGTCNNAPSGCSNDGECNTATTGNICRERSCACSGQTDCAPGCQVTGCGDGETCNQLNKRCERVRCSPSSPCPSGLDCVLGPAGGVCSPRSCTTDERCGDLFCVNGVCKSTLGVCGQIPP